MKTTTGDVIRFLDEIAPPQWAREGDRIGLQVGDPCREIERLWVALEVTPEVVSQASATPGALILSHHPLIYNPLHELRTDRLPGRLLADLLRAGLSVFVAHTNLDAAPRVGMAAVLAEQLGLLNPRPLLVQLDDPRLKLVTFSPPDAVEAVREALAAAGAGIIGAYTRCSFESEGWGRFVAGAGAQPHVGEAAGENRVAEVRLEMVLPAALLGEVVEALQASHPYEEPAFDLYPLASLPLDAGLGRVGDLPQALPPEQFDRLVRSVVATDQYWHGGAGPVRRVALLPGGSGQEVIDAAREADADLLLVGEQRYHESLDALHSGLQIVTAGHAETEWVALPALAERLCERFGEALAVEVMPAPQ
jgi:dinuclear metal center YbgI/SA1388 family protein